MIKIFLHIISVLGMLLILSSCSNDEYRYPSVQMEFVTAQTNNKGQVQSFITDKNKEYVVSMDKSSKNYETNQLKRIVTNYELVPSDKDTTACIYTSIATISSQPKKAQEFKDSIKTDPAEVLSIWMGMNYLNIVLNVLSQNKTHRFAFIQENAIIDKNGRINIPIQLYHDNSNDVMAFTQRVYLSIPLSLYAGNDNKGAIISFSLKTYDGTVKHYSFDYIPK